MAIWNKISTINEQMQMVHQTEQVLQAQEGKGGWLHNHVWLIILCILLANGVWNIVKMALEVCHKRQEESMKNSHTVLAMVLMEGIIFEDCSWGLQPHGRNRRTLLYDSCACRLCPLLMIQSTLLFNRSGSALIGE